MAVQTLTHSIWQILIDAAPWLVVGLLVAGLIKALFPDDLMTRWLGGHGLGAVLRAALIGTPLPLCSCSVLPTAIAVRRAGASKGATVSFLIATPENGVDSLALSYALLGPFMTIARLVAALLSAVFTGMLTEMVQSREDVPGQELHSHACSSTEGDCHTCVPPSTREEPLHRKVVAGLWYAATDLFGSIALWLSIGIVLAGTVNTLIHPDAISQWGGGLPAMLVMLLVSIPMYICATASTPVAAALLVAGVSPGTVLVFLLAGPATNIGSFGIVRKHIGMRAALCYLFTISLGSVVLGLATDRFIDVFNINVRVDTSAHLHMIPPWISLTSVCLLILMTLRLLVHRFIPTRSKPPDHFPHDPVGMKRLK